MIDFRVDCPACKADESVAVRYGTSESYNYAGKRTGPETQDIESDPCEACGKVLTQEEAEQAAQNDLEVYLEGYDTDPYGGDGPDD